MKKIIVHHFWSRGIRLLILVLMCLFHITQGLAQIEFRYDDIDNGETKNVYLDCDEVVLYGITYRFHPGDMVVQYDPAGTGIPVGIMLKSGHFTVVRYDEDLCSNVILFDRLTTKNLDSSNAGHFTITLQGQATVVDGEGSSDLTYPVIGAASGLFFSKTKLESVTIVFCVVIKGLKSVNNLPAPSIVPPFDVRSISCSCLYQMIE